MWPLPDVESTNVYMPGSLLKESLPSRLAAAKVAWHRPLHQHQHPQIKIAVSKPPAANIGSNNMGELM